LQLEQFTKKQAGLDHLRSIAILFVFVYHYIVFFEHPAWMESIGKFGWTGVDLFFVLSGYLISNQIFKTYYAQNKIDLKAFYLKRSLRIFPAYIFILALYFLFPIIREKESLSPLWNYLTFTNNFGLNVMHNGTFSHSWSLCVEEQFYLLFPIFLLALIYFKLLKKLLIFLIVFFLAGFFIRHFWWERVEMLFGYKGSFKIYWIMRIYFPTYCRLDGLLIGIAIAWLINSKPIALNIINKYGYHFLACGLAFLMFGYYLCINEYSYIASVYGFPTVSIGYGFILLAALSNNTFLHRNHSFITAKIATYSYSIYLSHKIIIHLCQKYLVNKYVEGDSFLMFSICLVLSILFAFLMYLYIEKPFMKIREQIISKINLAQ
jgi:peptidoglycan/LPS O-acetylase OafA/YrhL